MGSSLMPLVVGRPSYWVNSSNQAPTAQADLAAIEAGAKLDTAVEKVLITNPGLQTAGAVVKLQLLRTTTAGANGPVTPNPNDPDDPAFSGIARVAPTALGAAGAVLLEIAVFVPGAAAVFAPMLIDLVAILGKAPRIKAGITNGIAFRHPGVAGAAGFHCALLISEADPSK